MIPVISSLQMKEVDAYTIQNEPIASIDLMERAAKAFVSKFLELDHSHRNVTIFAGIGNNGGDGLAIARLLSEAGRQVKVFTIGKLDKASEDFQINRERLKEKCVIRQLDSDKDIPQPDHEDVIIDGLFGSGLSRPVEGLYADLIKIINYSGAEIFSIDIPSGLFADSNPENGAIIRASYTITFQTPKLAFFQPSLHQYTGEWHVVDIGLDKKFLSQQETDFYYTELSDIIFPQRSRFDHKGTAGRVLLVSGSKGKVGSTSLFGRAAMRTGCGLLYLHVPRCATNILQVNVQEAIILEDRHDEIITEVKPESNIDAIAIGPGIGTDPLTEKALTKLLNGANKPLVLDADALNILSKDINLVDLLPKGSILTPHPGEFKRMTGEWQHDFHKLEILKTFCRENHLNIVLKGAFSAVCNSQGKIYFNPTGNPGMATAGSGDVLTGMLAALLGQGFTPADSVKTGVYLHGLAADLAVREVGEVAMIASDIIEHIPMAILKNVKKYS